MQGKFGFDSGLRSFIFILVAMFSVACGSRSYRVDGLKTGSSTGPTAFDNGGDSIGGDDLAGSDSSSGSDGGSADDGGTDNDGSSTSGGDGAGTTDGSFATASENLFPLLGSAAESFLGSDSSKFQDLKWKNDVVGDGFYLGRSTTTKLKIVRFSPSGSLGWEKTIDSSNAAPKDIAFAGSTSSDISAILGPVNGNSQSPNRFVKYTYSVGQSGDPGTIVEFDVPLLANSNMKHGFKLRMAYGSEDIFVAGVTIKPGAEGAAVFLSRAEPCPSTEVCTKSTKYFPSANPVSTETDSLDLVRHPSGGVVLAHTRFQQYPTESGGVYDGRAVQVTKTYANDDIEWSYVYKKKWFQIVEDVKIDGEDILVLSKDTVSHNGAFYSWFLRIDKFGNIVSQSSIPWQQGSGGYYYPQEFREMSGAFSGMFGIISRMYPSGGTYVERVDLASPEGVSQPQSQVLSSGVRISAK